MLFGQDWVLVSCGTTKFGAKEIGAIVEGTMGDTFPNFDE